MTQKKTGITIGVRAAVGAAVIAVAATAVVFVGSIEAPEVERVPLSIDVDTTQNIASTLVCAGSFGELGADPSQPDVAVATGAPALAMAGVKPEERQLTRTVVGEGQPTVLQAPGDEPLAAAQLQGVQTETLKGAVASACAAPLNEQWLIGGETSLGVTTTLSLGNPGSVPASVQVTVYDAAGQVDAVQTAGVIVPAGTQTTLSMNGYAPDRKQLAVRVSSTGAPVGATLSVAHRVGLQSYGVSMVDSQGTPGTELVIAGLTNAAGHEDHAHDTGDGDGYPVFVRAFAPGGEGGMVMVRALDDKGHATELGSIEVTANAVGELMVPTWPLGAQALELTSTVPIVAAALGSADTEEEHDYDWFTPSPAIAAGQNVAVPVVSGGTLVLAHSGEGTAEVTITNTKGKAKKLKLSAGATVAVAGSNNSTITATGTIYAGVRYMKGANLAAYPVLPLAQRDGTLKVYTQ